MSTWYRQHHDCSYNGENRDESNGNAFTAPARRTPGRTNDANNLDHAKGDVEQDRLEVCVAKVSNDEIAKSRNTAACNAAWSLVTFSHKSKKKKRRK